MSGHGHRRIDRFIELALLGAHQTLAGRKPEPETALYLTSGLGDIPVFQRVRRQRYFAGMMSKPVDFINLGGNIAGFYVAADFGLARQQSFS